MWRNRRQEKLPSPQRCGESPLSVSWRTGFLCPGVKFFFPPFFPLRRRMTSARRLDNTWNKFRASPSISLLQKINPQKYLLR